MISGKKEFPALLDEGLHSLSMSDLETLCCRQVSSPRRQMLFDNLSIFISILQRLGVTGEIWIDGSFLTEKPEPDDIDLVVVIDYDTFLVISNSDHIRIKSEIDGAKVRYNLDTYCISNHPRHAARADYWIKQFGTFRDFSTPKGMASIKI